MMATGPEKFARILADYHKSKSARAERCIADIVELLCDVAASPEATNEQVERRIIQHYEGKDH